MRISHALVTLSLLALLPPGLRGNAESIRIVEDGQPKAAIILPVNASAQEAAAAATLQEYIRLSTGATLPINPHAEPEQPPAAAIHIGRTPYAAAHPALEGLDEDGFVIQGFGDGNLVIAGGSDWGTEFGVYDFLERYLGVYWLMPTEIGREIPAHTTLDIPLAQVREQPVYLSRQFGPIDITRTRPPRSYAPWRQYQFTDQWGRANRLRKRIEYHHNLANLFPPSRFAQSNPEFYPLVKGKRVIPKSDKDFLSWQPNFSAPGIVDAAAAEIAAYFARNPDEASYSLGVNDLRFYDESPESKARRSGKLNSVGHEDVSDDYYQWVNEVVAKVSETYPDKRYGLLAYSSVTEPPANTAMNPRVIPFLTYERLRWQDPVLRERDQSLTRRWAQKVPEVGWYDYAYGLNYLVPRLWPHLASEYLQWGANNNVRYYYAEMHPNWGEGPKPWVMAKLLWNPARDPDELAQIWYRNAVGEQAAPKLREFYALWEKFWTQDIFRQNWDADSTSPVWNRRSGQYLPFEITTYLLSVPEDYLLHSAQLLDQAAQLTQTPQQKARLDKIRQMWQVYESSVRAYKADNLWRSARLESEADALAFFDQLEAGLETAAQRHRLLESLREDDLLGHSAYRILRSPNTNGEQWGATSFWSLLPWAEKSEAIRARLQAQATAGKTARTREVAAQVLEQATAKSPSLLTNGSFEQGMRGWTTGPTRASTAVALQGEHSLLATGFASARIEQSIPCVPGNYYATVSAFIPEGASSGKAALLLATTDPTGRSRGRELPAGDIPLKPGQWTTCIIPFTVDREVQRIGRPMLRLTIRLEGFRPEERIYFDDIGVYLLDPKPQ